MPEVQGLISLGVWEIFATLANTFILFLIVKKFLFKPVTSMLEAREKEVADMYSSAEGAKNSAETMEKEYKEKIKNAKEEVAEILRIGKKNANESAEKILQDASKQASNMMSKAEVSIEQDRKYAMNTIKNDISDMAILAAAKIVEREIKAGDHKKYIEDFIGNVGE